jgi:hypothetical protein
MCNIPVNSFFVLNSYDDDKLELIATNCDIVLGGVGKKIYGNINAIQMEEIVRAAIAEANYKHSQEVMLIAQHVLEGENLNLEIIENQQRGVLDNSPAKRGRKKLRRDRLSREQKCISYK